MLQSISSLRLVAFLTLSAFTVRAGDAILINTLTGESQDEFYSWHVSTPILLGGPENLVGFTLQVHGNETRFLPNAFDGISTLLEPDAPDRAGIAGRLHQEQIQVVPGVTIPSPDLETSMGSIYDTHFLHTRDQVVGIGPPFIEDPIDDSTSDEPGEFLDLTATGYSDGLTGIFGVLGRPTELIWDLAYVVVPFDSVMTIDATVAGLNPETETAREGLFTFTFDVASNAEAAIPEPMSTTLGFTCVTAWCFTATGRRRWGRR